MTSYHIILLFIGGMEVGYIHAPTNRLCQDAMTDTTASLSDLWGQQVNAVCRDTGVPIIRPVARPW